VGVEDHQVKQRPDRAPGGNKWCSEHVTCCDMHVHLQSTISLLSKCSVKEVFVHLPVTVLFKLPCCMLELNRSVILFDNEYNEWLMI
jgi:hypothetical protein